MYYILQTLGFLSFPPLPSSQQYTHHDNTPSDRYVPERVTVDDLQLASLAWGFTIGFGFLTQDVKRK
jgi:hypothetical protein